MGFLKMKFCATVSEGFFFFFLGFLSVEKLECVTLCVCVRVQVHLWSLLIQNYSIKGA